MIFYEKKLAAPKLFLSILVCCLLSRISLAQTVASDKSALLSWTPAVLVLGDWRQQTDPCNNKWTGITCTQINGQWRVTGINLSNQKILGTISPNLGSLQALTTLDLSQNSLNGVIPSSLGSLPFLRILNLSVNQLVGQIPKELGSIRTLETLILSTNSITGTIPSEIGFLSNLQTLFLFENQLSGTIPDSVSNQLTKLQLIDLSRNQLKGSLPTFAGSPALQSINVKNNQISGQFPDSYYNLPALGFIDVSSNSISGSIPSNTGYIRQLGYLYMSNNLIQGTIPVEFGNLRNLGFLSLAYNKLVGSIPVELASCPFASLDLSYNRLSGDVPPVVSQISQRATTNVDCNALTGSSTLFKQGSCAQCSPGFMPTGNSRQCKATFTITPLGNTNGSLVETQDYNPSNNEPTATPSATLTPGASPSYAEGKMTPSATSIAQSEVILLVKLKGTVESFQSKSFLSVVASAINEPLSILRVIDVASGSVIAQLGISSSDESKKPADDISAKFLGMVESADSSLDSLGIMSVQKKGDQTTYAWGQGVNNGDNQQSSDSNGKGSDDNNLALPLGVGLGVGVGSILIGAVGYKMYKNSKSRSAQPSEPYPNTFTAAPVIISETPATPTNPLQPIQNRTVPVIQLRKSELALFTPTQVRTWLSYYGASEQVVEALFQDGVTGARILNATLPLLLRAFNEHDANLVWGALCTVIDDSVPQAGSV